MAESTEEYNEPMLLLFNGEQLLLNSDTMVPDESWPLIPNVLPAETSPQLYLLEDGQIAISNGLQLFMNPLNYMDMKGDGQMLPHQFLSLLMTDDQEDLLSPQPDDDPLVDSSEGMLVDDLEEEDEDLSSLVDVVMTYKCRMCQYPAPSRELLIEHITSEHIQQASKEEQLESSSSPPDDLSTFGPDDPSIQEKMVFLCAQCAEAFDSLEACRLHMVEDHRLVTEEQDKASSPETSSTIPDPEPSPPPPPPPLPEIKEEPREKRKTHLPKALGEGYILGKHFKLEPDSTFKCAHFGCSAKFSSEKELDLHYLCHNNEEEDFKCFECKQQFDKWKPLSVHLWRSHQVDVGMVTCKVCNFKAVTPLRLANHARIHCSARNFVCSICHKSFKQLSQLKNHCVLHTDRSSAEAIATPRWYTAKECNICHKTYADAKCLKKHLTAVHGKLKPYSCPVCGHTSAGKAMMQLHLRQHTGEKPYGCDTCSFRTGDHNSLRRHKMRHTGTKPYQCPHCSYASIQSSSYKNHLRNRHPDKEGGAFECSQCPYRCVSEEAYIAHQGDHKREQKSSKKAKRHNETFPGNVAAANFIFRCLNTLNNREGRNVKANISSQDTSPDGSTQTITIRIPADEDDGCIRVEDLVKSRPEPADEPDLGGITIPADPTPPPPVTTPPPLSPLGGDKETVV